MAHLRNLPCSPALRQLPLSRKTPLAERHPILRRFFGRSGRSPHRRQIHGKAYKSTRLGGINMAARDGVLSDACYRYGHLAAPLSSLCRLPESIGMGVSVAFQLWAKWYFRYNGQGGNE